MKKFSTGRYGRQTLEFFPAPFRAPLRAFAALVFPWSGEEVLLCNICDRGWCIPSGRVEPEESSQEAALREALEEAGAVLIEPQYIGCYRISERSEVRWADVFAATVGELVEITCPHESRGRQLVTFEQLPDVYYQWTPLLDEVFRYSREVVRRHQPFGKSG